MPLTVTPGDASADSYLSVADAKAYWGKVGYDFSGQDDTAIEEALRRGTAWLDGRFRGQYPGKRANGRSQALEWPRKDAYDREHELVGQDVIPQEIEDATAEAARRELEEAGSLSPDVTTGNVIRSETVGPISTEYAGIASTDAQRPTLTVVEGILSSLFRVGGSTTFLSRA